MKRQVIFTVLFIVALSSSITTAKELKPTIIPEEDKEGYAEVIAVPDPLEKFNRAMFTFNDKLYFYALKPAAKGYRYVVPEKVRISIRKAFNNIALPVRFTNCLLQGKIKGAGVEASRFAINTTVGIAGLFDPAQSYCKMNPYDEDTDQTLGYYCIDNGFYIVWPFLGPSSVRGTVGLGGDVLLHPFTYLLDMPEQIAVRSFQVVNDTSLSIGTYEDLKKAALDPYIAVKSAYFQHRQHKVNK